MGLLSFKQYVSIFILKFIGFSSFIYAGDFNQDGIDGIEKLSKHDLRQRLRDEFDKNKHLQEELEHRAIDLLKVRKQRNHQQKRHHFYKEKYIKLRREGKKIQEDKSQKRRRKMKTPTLRTDQSQSKKPSVHKTSSVQQTIKNSSVQISHNRAPEIHVEHLAHGFTDQPQRSTSSTTIRPLFDHWSSFDR